MMIVASPAPVVTNRIGCVRSLIALLLLTAVPCPALSAGEAGTLILDLDGSMWRYFDTWETDVARLDSGGLVRVDPLDPREFAGGDRFRLAKAKRTLGSEQPPAGWQTCDFDDSRWQRRNAYWFLQQYRAISRVCLRGKFQVTDPSRASDLKLDIGFRGGVVVYLNGSEVGRAFLPKGELSRDTLAEDYPKECYIASDGTLIRQANISGLILAADQIPKENKAADAPEGYRKRTRALSVAVPAKYLRKGTNVLAVEVRRAPAIPEMFTIVGKDHDCLLRVYCWWNRCAIESLKLTAPGDGWFVPNAERPRGVQVFNQDVITDVNLTHYGDPCERISPIIICGAKNGAFSGDVVVSSAEPIRGLKTSMTDLKKVGGGVIPSTAVEIRCAGKSWEGWVPNRLGHWLAFDGLEDVPSEVPVLSGWRGTWAAAPIWVTVHVPPDAAGGDYSGALTVQADGLAEPVEVPVHLHVSDWTLPDPTKFTTVFSSVQSPDSLALQYDVPMWSEAHWKLIDRSFQLLGRIGVDDIYIPVIPRTHFGNDHGMVHWIKQQGGRYKLDFSIVEKYLDTAIKHLGKVPVVCAFLLDAGPYHAKGPAFTEVDPQTGNLSEAMGPSWGTPQSVEFLKPLVAGLQDVLAKRGMKNSLGIGMHAAGGAGPESDSPQAVPDMLKAWPEAKFHRLSHMWYGETEVRPSRPKYRYVSLVSGILSVFWDVDEDKPIYGWKNPDLVMVYPRTNNMDYSGVAMYQSSGLPEHRLAAESSLLAGRRRKPRTDWSRGDLSRQMGFDKFQGLRGFGPLGADFWPVLKGAKGSKDIIGRFGDGYAEGGWGTISMHFVVQAILAPGKDGPVPTQRLEMIRESLQEAEARIFVQNALLDAARRKKLGPALEKKTKELCDNRTRYLRYMSELWTSGGVQGGQPQCESISPRVLQDMSKDLYDLAAEVAKAVGTK